MKLLIDANLSPRIAAALHQAGYETCHVQPVRIRRREEGPSPPGPGSRPPASLPTNASSPSPA